MSRLHVLFVFLVLLPSSQVTAQRFGPGPADRTDDPLPAKVLAKAKRAVTQADRGELLRARQQAAQTEYDGRATEFLAGRGSLSIFRDAIDRLREADLALCSTYVQRLAVREAAWLRLWLFEDMSRDWYEKGRIPAKEYWEGKHLRLGAELELLRERAGRVKLPSGVSLPSAAPFLPADGSLLSTKELAKAKFAASRAVPQDLDRRRLRLIRGAFRSRFLECFAGRCSLDLVLEVAGKMRDAALAISRTEAERLAPVEGHWTYAHQIDSMERRRYEAGRVPIQYRLQTLQFRLAAEITLIQARAQQTGKRTEARTLPSNLVILWDVRDDEVAPETGGLIYTKSLARAKFAAIRGNPESLIRDKRAADQAEVGYRFREFLNGRGTLDILLGSATRLLEDELALSTTEAERRAARERHWARLKQIRDVNKVRREQERIPVQDDAQTAYFLIDAELGLIGSTGGPAAK